MHQGMDHNIITFHLKSWTNFLQFNIFFTILLVDVMSVEKWRTPIIIIIQHTDVLYLKEM